MEPLLILFDIDGTLVDTAGAGRRAAERAFAETWQIDLNLPGKTVVRYSGRTDPEIFRALAEAFELDGAEYRSREERLREAYLTALRAEMARPDARRRVLPGVNELLDSLIDADDVHLGLLTGNLECGARIKLDPFGLTRYFQGGGFGSDHADRGRIAALAHRRLSDRTGIRFPPSRVVVVGDTEHDVACARVNDFRVVAVASGWISTETLRRAGPDALFSDLADQHAVRSALGLE